MEAELKWLRQGCEILKQGFEHCQPEPTTSYQIIESSGEVGSVEYLCRASGVSVSGYYIWRNPAASQRQQGDEALLHAIRAVYQVGRGFVSMPRNANRACCC